MNCVSIGLPINTPFDQIAIAISLNYNSIFIILPRKNRHYNRINQLCKNVFVLGREETKKLHQIYRITGTKRPMSVIHKNEHNPHISLSALHQPMCENGQSKK